MKDVEEITDEEQAFLEQHRLSNVHEVYEEKRHEYVRHPENRIRLLEGLIAGMEETLRTVKEE